MFETVLVPLDGSELAETALPAAAAFSRTYGARLIALRVVESGYAEPSFFEGGGNDSLCEARACAKAYVEHIAYMLSAQGCSVRSVCVDGAVAESILYAASVYKAGLIMLTRHGRGHSSAWPIGRNVERVIKSAQCPVLLLG